MALDVAFLLELIEQQEKHSKLDDPLRIARSMWATRKPDSDVGHYLKASDPEFIQVDVVKCCVEYRFDAPNPGATSE